MFFYQFIIGKHGIQIEDLGDVPLSDDHSAFAFAARVIRDCLMHKDTARYAGCTMDIAEDKRAVGSVPFEIKAYERATSDQANGDDE